jgi:hypothetical protein
MTAAVLFRIVLQWGGERAAVQAEGAGAGVIAAVATRAVEKKLAGARSSQP